MCRNSRSDYPVCTISSRSTCSSFKRLNILITTAGSTNQQYSTPDVVYHNAQEYQAPPSSVLTGVPQPSHPSTTAFNLLGGGSEAYQSYPQAGYVQGPYENYDQGFDSTPGNIPSGYSRDIRVDQSYPQLNTNQNFGGVRGPSPGFHTHSPLTPADSSSTYLGSEATYISQSNFQGPITYSAPHSRTHSLNQLVSSPNVPNSNSPKTFSSLSQNTTPGANSARHQRANTFAYTTTPVPRKTRSGLLKRVTSVLSGLDRQLDNFTYYNKPGRALVGSGPAPLPGVVDFLNANNEPRVN